MAVATSKVRDRIVRRREILLAAGRVFIRKGFRLASMEDIAAAASVAVGTLYHYFRSKEHLYVALLAESTHLLSQRLREAAAKPLPPALGLLALNRAYADFFVEYPDFFRIQIFFQNQTEAPPEFADDRRRIQEQARRNFDFLAEKIRDGQKTGIFRGDLDPLAAAAALWASYNGIFLAATSRPTLETLGLDIESLLGAAAALHFTGIASDRRALMKLRPMKRRTAERVSLSDLQRAIRSAPWLEPATIFEGMPLVFQAEKARGVRHSFEYRISGPRGGTWTVTIDDGRIAVAAERAERPSVVFEVSDSDFMAMVTGSAKVSDLLMSGRLKARGDLQAATTFRSFFLLAQDER